MPGRRGLTPTAVALVALIGLGAALWAWDGIGTGGSAATESPEAHSADGVPSPRAPTDPYPRPGPGLNLLALEASPYLQLHSHNPVDWYPWGDAAFERARAEDKPIFLSIGYSTCYWCHVMEREVFSNSAIAALMNEHFISIKVDREERPDIDAVYMDATQLLSGSGGWPNSLFVDPDGRPFFAGTYFPPADARGRPGFPNVLARIHDAWSQEREKVTDVASRVAERIGELASAELTSDAPGSQPAIEEVAPRALAALAASYEPVHGGFSRQTKFPRPPALELLLTALERKADPERLAMLTHTLDEMALGGIYDQLAGGFHRYATEPTWSIPHFEKMLYDNAQLVGVYARAYALTKRPLYRRVAEETIAYLDREMSLPEGGFASAQDAEVGGEEGASYVWRRSEIEALLGAERAKTFFGVYELTPTRDDPEVGVLRVRVPIDRTLERTKSTDIAALLARFDDARSALLTARRQRPQPLRDDKALAAWNALAIRALVEASASLGEPELLGRAERAAHFLLARLRADDGALHRSYIAGQSRETGVLDDYAFVADALLALHRATGDGAWLDEARSVADGMLARFRDSKRGGFFMTAKGSRLLVRPKPFDDGDMPSGNGVALRALLDLAAATGDPRYAEAAADIPRAAAPFLESAPSAVSALVAALLEEQARAPVSPASTRTKIEVDTANSSAPTRPRFPRSDDHVRATASSAPGAPGRLHVGLRIDPGWHVNANPASLPFLIPTEVEFGTSDAVAEIHYPEGRAFRPQFAQEAIRVYDGDVAISVVLQPGTPTPTHVALRFQACDEQICLPPGRAEIGVEGRP